MEAKIGKQQHEGWVKIWAMNKDRKVSRECRASKVFMETMEPMFRRRHAIIFTPKVIKNTTNYFC